MPSIKSRLKKSLIRYISVIALKLIFFGLLIMCVFTSFLYFLNESYFHLFSFIPIFIGLLPFISFGLFCIKSLLKNEFRNSLTYCKYNLHFPFYFFYDRNPEKSAQINLKKIVREVQTGDVLLRRYDGYLDGLIFSENSYFTHVGICERNTTEDINVWHCNGESGVHRSSLNEFCSCENIAILRFSLDETEEEKLIRKYIRNEPLIYDDSNFTETGIFESLIQKIKGQNSAVYIQGDNITRSYQQLILKRARSLAGKPYDFNFNFNSFESFSCIEYVWYCFKFLFPLHRIRVKDFEFFQIFNMPIIVPDVFIRNDYFHYVYSSLEKYKVDGKNDLIKFVRKGRKEIWNFLCSILLWDLFILFLCFFIFSCAYILNAHLH